MADSITLRRYRTEDCEAILRLFRDTVYSVNCRDYTPEQLGAWTGETDPEKWNRSLRANVTYVAEDHGKIVGFADLDIDVSCSMCATATLDKLYVHKDFQRQGIGRILVKSLEKYAVENAVGLIRTYASMTSVPFFKAMGYAVVRENTVERQGVELKNCFMRKRL